MKRQITKQLLYWRDNLRRKPLILHGARQVGKTYSLLKFGKKYYPAFHYVNFEQDEQLSAIFKQDLQPKRIIKELSFYLDCKINSESDLLILDEIQECPRAISSLKYFQEEMPAQAICAAGSLLGVHLGDASFPVGKVEFLDMYPLSFPEFLQGTGEDDAYNFLMGLKTGDSIPEIIHTRLWSHLKNYMVIGGLPEAINTYRRNKNDLFTAFKAVRKTQTDLITTYMADMAKHSGKLNSMHIERLWRDVPAQLAREQDGSAPKFKFKGVVPGLSSYSRLAGVIDWLVKAGLICKVQIVNSGHIPFSAYGKENFFKLYCFDIGLLNALGNLPPKSILAYDYGTYKGYVAENFVAQEFIASGSGPLYCWRERTAEVEFLREIDGEVVPIEIKSGWVTQAKSLKVFTQKYCPPYRTVMSGKNLFLDEKNKIHHYPLFLASRFPLALRK